MGEIEKKQNLADFKVKYIFMHWGTHNSFDAFCKKVLGCTNLHQKGNVKPRAYSDKSGWKYQDVQKFNFVVVSGHDI